MSAIPLPDLLSVCDEFLRSTSSVTPVFLVVSVAAYPLSHLLLQAEVKRQPWVSTI